MSISIVTQTGSMIAIQPDGKSKNKYTRLEVLTGLYVGAQQVDSLMFRYPNFSESGFTE